jgi:hypothetical protein
MDSFCKSKSCYFLDGFGGVDEAVHADVHEHAYADK